MDRFAGKTVLVTGAASGIGRAAARRFADEGASVVVMDLDRNELEEASAELPKDRLLIQPGDTSRKDAAVTAVKAAVERFGRLDVLVNNAGIATKGVSPRPARRISKTCWRQMSAATSTRAKAAMPELVKTKGSIVMTSSVSGLGGDWEMFAYNTSKGAVTNMVRAMALDAAKDGVRVNAVNPSFTDSGMTKEMQAKPELMAKFRERMPLGSPAQPEDIAAVMAFLASDDARFVTGVNLPVDGGLLASNGQPPQ